LNKKIYVGIACAALILTGAFYYLFWGEKTDDSAAEPQTASSESANLIFAGSSIVEEQDGKKIWELSADKIEADPNGNTLYLNKLKGVFYQETGNTIEIIAQRAVLDRKTRDLSLQGDIKITAASDGAVFTAPEVRWSGEAKSFTGTGGITVTRNGTKITGDNIISDAKLEKIRVYGNAKILTGGKTE